MAISPKRLKWYLVFAGLIFIAILIFSSMQQNVYRYEVCVSYNGRSHCAQASGPKPSDAIRSAQEIDCELLSSGRDQNMACLDLPPASVRRMNRR